ncbi:MAG: hypothetical protein HY423_06835 [Candidatus Lambdaproteobacteria bacterium]|nr:hypothetical protein [Candidatus Lambdaproteobacteria bacterium]
MARLPKARRTVSLQVPALVALLLGLLASPRAALAYEPSLEELYANLLAKAPTISRLILRLHTTVYDPLVAHPAPRADAALPEPPPREQPEREFLQAVYWMRGQLLAIETTSPGGSPLHFYYDEGFRPLTVNAGEKRTFADLDILPPYLPFIEGTLADWRRGLGAWGVLPDRYELARAPKGVVYYRLEEAPGKAAWIDKGPLRLARIDTRIGGDELPISLSIRFNDFLSYGEAAVSEKNMEYPLLTDYFAEGRLFRQTRVADIQVDPPVSRFPVQRLREQAQAEQERRRSSAEAGAR